MPKNRFVSVSDCQLLSPLVSEILISRMTGTSLSLTSLPHSGLFHLILPPALPHIPTTVFLVWEKWKDTQITELKDLGSSTSTSVSQIYSSL